MDVPADVLTDFLIHLLTDHSFSFRSSFLEGDPPLQGRSKSPEHTQRIHDRPVTERGVIERETLFRHSLDAAARAAPNENVYKGTVDQGPQTKTL